MGCGASKNDVITPTSNQQSKVPTESTSSIKSIKEIQDINNNNNKDDETEKVEVRKISNEQHKSKPKAETPRNIVTSTRLSPYLKSNIPTPRDDFTNKNYDMYSNEQLFCKQAIEEVNKLRSKHQSEPLQLSLDLCKMAQEHSKYLATSQRLVSSNFKFQNEKLGENLCIYADTKMNNYTGNKAVKYWYNESKDYVYDKRSKLSTNNFTQLVWKSSKLVGFGISKAKNGSFYAVALFYPAGNISEKYQENVLKENNNHLKPWVQHS